MTETGPIKSITISGFRAILTPFRLNFDSRSPVGSMVLYGRNGTGKSSVTDAWEWLQSGKIDHLAREGAGEASFRHLKAAKDDVFVQVELADPEAPPALRRLLRKEGDDDAAEQQGLTVLSTLAPHPCQIRFGDLTRFVYMTKSDRYDLLARLMGVDRQVRLGKKLRRIQKAVSSDVLRRTESVVEQRGRIRESLGAKSADSPALVEAVRDICAAHDIACEPTLQGISEAADVLRETVQNDPQAAALADEKLHRLWVRDATLQVGPARVCDEWGKWSALEVESGSAQDAAFVNLFDAADRLLSDPVRRGVDSACPLCGQTFEGDLVAHVQQELARLRPVREYVGVAAHLARDLAAAVETFKPLVDALPSEVDEAIAGEALDERMTLGALRGKGERLISCAEEGISALQECRTDLTSRAHDSCQSKRIELCGLADAYERSREKCHAACEERVRVLEDDETRAELVVDQSRVATAIRDLRNLGFEEEVLRLATQTEAVMSQTTDAFVSDCAASVRSRFNAISADVDDYFSVLERHTEGVKKPALKFGEDQDRAVTLEIVFRGKTVSHAYAYLSESQLNSFGLAVFLASVRQFNPRFRFMLLDDIINSLDMYKRPALIELLKTRFADHQVLLMTHDDIWREELRRSFPNWAHRRFNRLQYLSGPVMLDSPGKIERVLDLVGEDRADEAGAILGPYLERRLQDICEAFEVLIRFRRDNAHTLEPLLDRLRVRVKEKLGTSHSLCAAIDALWADSAFRNFCSHWKNQPTGITPEEISQVVTRWEAIESQVVCTDCSRLLVYSDDCFKCGCGNCMLTRALVAGQPGSSDRQGTA